MASLDQFLSRVNNRVQFWTKVEVTDSCWNWKGAIVHGYGEFYLKGERYYAHRIAYVLGREPIPPNKEIHHTCENRSCVNPSHMELLTKGQHTLKGNCPPRYKRSKDTLPCRTSVQ